MAPQPRGSAERAGSGGGLDAFRKARVARTAISTIRAEADGSPMGSLPDMLSRGWENFTARPSGPLNLRFLLQPTIAGLIALRAGLSDARAGAPPYLWAAVTDGAYRRALLRGGWKDLRTPFFVALILDAVYQTITHDAIYLFELLFTATLLPLVPYLLIRGPVNRLARTIARQKGHADVRHSNPH